MMSDILAVLKHWMVIIHFLSISAWSYIKRKIILLCETENSIETD